MDHVSFVNHGSCICINKISNSILFWTWSLRWALESIQACLHADWPSQLLENELGEEQRIPLIGYSDIPKTPANAAMHGRLWLPHLQTPAMTCICHNVFKCHTSSSCAQYANLYPSAVLHVQTSNAPQHVEYLPLIGKVLADYGSILRLFHARWSQELGAWSGGGPSMTKQVVVQGATSEGECLASLTGTC